MKNIITTLGLTLAVGLGVWQGPHQDSDRQIDELAVTGSDLEAVAVAVCPYTGYTQVACSFINPPCTGGNVQLSESTAGENTHRRTGWTNTGNCTGPAGCSTTVRTGDLTTNGCGGGGGAVPGAVDGEVEHVNF